jgi:hypothetical protein
MAFPQTTEEIAAHVSKINRRNPQMAAATRVPADEFGRLIRERLPYLDPADIAAVLLHTASFLGTTVAQFRTGGLDDMRATVAAVNIVAHAGERMNREAERRPGDGTAAG